MASAAKDMTDLMIWEILVCFVGAIGEEEVSAGAAPSFRFAEIGCVAVDVKDHVAFGVREDGIRMGGNVVQEVMGSLHGVFLVGEAWAEASELRATNMVASTAQP